MIAGECTPVIFQATPIYLFVLTNVKHPELQHHRTMEFAYAHVFELPNIYI